MMIDIKLKEIQRADIPEKDQQSEIETGVHIMTGIEINLVEGPMIETEVVTVRRGIIGDRVKKGGNPRIEITGIHLEDQKDQIDQTDPIDQTDTPGSLNPVFLEAEEPRIQEET